MSDCDKFSIVIVNKNTRELLKNCISSIYEKNKYVDFEIIVIDNASHDGSYNMIQKYFPEVKLYVNDHNVGYSKANNQGIKIATSNNILLLNSDTEIKSDEPLIKILEYMRKNREIGIIGVKLVYPDGTIQAAGRSFLSLYKLFLIQVAFWNSPVLRKMGSYFVRKRPFSTDYIDGAFFVIRKKVIDDIGPMNEDYFLYGEDMEWCLRAKKNDWRIAVLPNIEVIHYHGQSTRDNLSFAVGNSVKNTCRFLEYAHSKFYAQIAYLICLAGLLLRIILNFVYNRRKSEQYWRAFKYCIRTGF